MPPIWALVILTVPPLLAGTYAGISSVDRNVVDAARAMGMTEWQVLFRAEFPNALPVMYGGFRTGVLQVIATVSVVAYINLAASAVTCSTGSCSPTSRRCWEARC